MPTMQTTRSRLGRKQVVLTTSTSEAYSFLFRLLCDPGNEILVPQPGYPLFDFLAGLDDVRLKAAPLVYDYGWQIDPEGFRRAITAETRAIVLVHPNNPTGHFTKEWEGDRAGAIVPGAWACAHRGRGLSGLQISGEMAGAHASFAQGLDDVPVFVVSGLSKIAGLPQMKAAWIVATGPGRRDALDRLEVIADTFLSMNAPVQCAMPVWLEGHGKIQRQIQERVAGNLAELDRVLAGQEAIRRLEVEGGWYAVLRIPAVQPDQKTVLELLERGVWVHPGYFFGMKESGWLVVSLLAAKGEFSAGAFSLGEFFERRRTW